MAQHRYMYVSIGQPTQAFVRHQGGCANYQSKGGVELHIGAGAVFVQALWLSEDDGLTVDPEAS